MWESASGPVWGGSLYARITWEVCIPINAHSQFHSPCFAPSTHCPAHLESTLYVGSISGMEEDGKWEERRRRGGGGGGREREESERGWPFSQ